ncbi:hypothetical protein V8G54_003064 [Vigna mungo]|uniref:Reverse transcriptase Ty1/copia-type domain-containing protein n=1 Tax=Vigna mungo TaxID=3915 RepID=A0AAQ3PBF2_VIGMU
MYLTDVFDCNQAGHYLCSKLVPRYMSCASKIHFKAVKRILRYIKGTISYRVNFQLIKDSSLYEYLNSDRVESNDDMKNTSNYCIIVGFGIFFMTFKRARSHSTNYRLSRIHNICCSRKSCNLTKKTYG